MTMTRWLRSAACAPLLLAACVSGSDPGPDSMVGERVDRVENGLLPYHSVAEQEAFALEDRLRFYQVPGVSVAVIHEGRLEWARAWGEVEMGSGTPVTPETLFQAASISKPVMAVGALRLVEEGVLALDDDVNGTLRSWRLPDNTHTGSERVTLRRLLSHTAGTTVHGFPGYPEGTQVPSIVQVLDGAGPTNTAPVRVDTIPGSLWRYSGGGSSVVQLLMMDALDRPFPELMEELVLRPLGMDRSSYAQPLPAERASEAATAHGPDGEPVRGRFHTYPEMAAAGLWTTPSDLALLALEIQRAANGEEGRILSTGMAREMLTVVEGSYGPGFSLDGEGDDLWFSHGGANRGFRAHFTASATSGRGAVVMTNSDGGGSLADEILRAVAREYGWDRMESVIRETVPLTPEARAELVGRYEFDLPDGSETILVELTHRAGSLEARVPRLGWERRSVRAAAPDTLFFLESGGELVVERGADGGVAALQVRGLGNPFRAERSR
jgi:CubicO group peptidase (beta-lactamase class C family)